MTDTKTEATRKDKKPKKKKGPIRVEAVGPFLIITALIVAYFTLFFDGHLRKGLEWGLTYVNGAEVNVDSASLSFRDAGFELGRIQFTNADKPDRNRFEIGRIRFDFLWDGLLRGKLVTEDAGITGIAANTPRARPGRVLTGEEKEESNAIRRKVLDEFNKRFEATGLAQIVDLLKGFDPSKEVEKLVGDLESVRKVAQLQADLDAKQAEWQKMLTEVPGEKELASLQAEIDGLKTTGIKSPADAKARLESASSLVKRSQSAINDVEKKASGLQSDLASFQGRIAESGEWIAADRRALQSKLKLPDLDPQSLTGQLFREPAVKQVAQVREYAEMAKKYVPEKKAKPVEPPRARATGRIYRFPVTHSYPLFWLKRAEISSSVGPSEYSGELRGELTDATTDPQIVGRPMVLRLLGDFPKQSIAGVSLQVTLDHRQEPARQSLALKVASFPTAARNFLESDTLVFGLTKAVGSLDVDGSLVGGEMNLRARHTFNQPEFNIGGGSDVMVGLMKNAASTLKDLWFQLEAKGSLDNLSIGMDSNIGAALARTLSAQLDAQVKRARELVEKRIDQEVGAQQKALVGEFNAQKRSLTAEVEARKAKAEALQAKAERKVAELKKQATGGALDKVKKKFSF